MYVLIDELSAKHLASKKLSNFGQGRRLHEATQLDMDVVSMTQTIDFQRRGWLVHTPNRKNTEVKAKTSGQI